ncbi:MAG: signal peptide peptidase SppA [Synechocystis sp.]|nr:signal peptide peptidase SppA [Synechocystis sp.]
MKDFFKQLCASFVGTIAAILILLSFGTGSIIFLVLLLSSTGEIALEENTALVLDLSVPIRDTNPPLSLSQSLLTEKESSVPLRTVVNAIEQAAQDDRIVALLIDGRQGDEVSGYANLRDVHQALVKFKQAGKKVIAYGLTFSEPGYYLASTADQVLLNPLGGVELNGLGAEPMFLTGAFEKYGIGVQTVRVGTYKGAIEPFTRQNLSPENREQQQALLDQIWQGYRETVAKNRNLSSAQIQAIADQDGLLFAEGATANQLVDQEMYWDQVLDELKKAGVEINAPALPDTQTEKSFRHISLKDYQTLWETEQIVDKNAGKIAIVYLEGAIVNGNGTWQTVGGDRYSKLLREIRADQDIKAVVLRINSPGGSASAADIIWREVDLLQQQKPVIISMGNVAASGGYWIATAGQTILAQPSTVTGSIGVFSLLFNVEDLGNRVGLTWDEVTTAKLANLGSTVSPKSDLELAVYQRAVNRVYELFIDKVAESRNLSPEQVNAIAQGRVWTGEAAQKIGLVDQLGGLNTALTVAAEQGKLGSIWQVEEYPARKGLNVLLLENLGQSLAPLFTAHQTPLPEPLQAPWQQVTTEWQQLSHFNDPQGIYVRLPFWLQFD